MSNDVVTEIGLLRQGTPDTVKAFGSLSTAATATKAPDTKNKGTDGARDHHTKIAHRHGATGEEAVDTVAN
jgi:hypothetical protein